MTNKFTKPCQHCGEPMLVARGGVDKYTRPGTMTTQLVKNPDQNAQFHGKCRKEGRRLRHKVMKRHMKEQNAKN